MFQEDLKIVRQMIREEIALALAALKPVAKVAKIEPTKPVVVETKVETVSETPFKKGKKED
jgi:hypothetical protein